MKQLFILLLTISLQANAQTIINYGTWTGTSACNAFALATNVPATINGSTGTVTHLSTVGQPKWSNIDKAVELDGTLSAGQPYGTEYRIAYNFKQNYSYTITVNTGSNVSTLYAPYLRLRITNTTNTSTLCNGPRSIDQNTGGTLTYSFQINNNNGYQDKVYNFPSISSANSYLTIANIPHTLGPTSQNIFIKKITITETAPTASFTLSPTSVPKVCGTALTQTFTITNVNSTPGVSSYVWNLGASNGWKYNNAPAQPTITTPTNTLTLTADACASSLSNVSASAVIGGTSYSAGTATASLSTPIMSIDGGNVLCTSSGTYSIANIPCNATVSWTSSNTSIATVSPTGNPVTVTKVGSGNMILKATLTGGACFTNNEITKNIVVGVPNASNITHGAANGTGSMQGIDFFYNGSIYWDGTGYSKYLEFESLDGHIIYGNPANDLGQRFGAGVIVNVNSGSGSSVYLKARAYNTCGFSSWAYFTIPLNGQYAYQVSPNPATDVITISEKQPSGSEAKRWPAGISEIKIFDNMGNLMKRSNYSGGTKQAQVNTSRLKTGVYFIEITSGQNKERQQVVIQK